MLLLKFSSVAAKANIDPRIGPIHGVHPNPNAAPTSNGKDKLLLYWPVKNLISLFINFKLITPMSCNEKNIITMPAIILKMFELFKKNFPRKDAAEPKVINTRENPNVKKTVLITIKLFFFLTSLSKDVPEM